MGIGTPSSHKRIACIISSSHLFSEIQLRPAAGNLIAHSAPGLPELKIALTTTDGCSHAR